MVQQLQQHLFGTNCPIYLYNNSLNLNCFKGHAETPESSRQNSKVLFFLIYKRNIKTQPEIIQAGFLYKLL
ncbi:hypothetical protein SAMN04488522_1021078 [Pedobacter caeni]|uniref:Uncharacterized protein n=1 Tax=Pedobacter caeni TaxID=288992 RepID=A0A1M5B9M8_9SPHI|nr:hypothetical protein SAMN04488522_1021078 [Pedobacter caeni]